ncbi:hypothetical protein [uncultured Sanguibacteroides sp.]|uniref:hypothetical protein n=1 Tax=uncultured Sanguibacteroides sp. TaxID=1635151 RepID=UPI0025D4DD6B|nr:hypothetical protein [uncultured Sanguibacteroides sp.]
MDIISQKTDVIGQISDFIDIFENLSKENVSIKWLQEDQTKSKFQTYWWLDDDKIVYNSCVKSFLFPLEALSETTSESNVIPLSNEDFKIKYRDYFLDKIKSTKFVSGEDNLATELMATLMNENKDATLSLLTEYVINIISNEILDESLLVKIILMLTDYDYNDLFPISQTIALNVLKLKNTKVNSAAFNLFGHWGNREALNMLRKYDEPVEPWLKMKYNVILHSLEERCSMLVK